MVLDFNLKCLVMVVDFNLRCLVMVVDLNLRCKLVSSKQGRDGCCGDTATGFDTR